MTSKAKSIFDKNICMIDEMMPVYDYLTCNAQKIDCSMLLRSFIVLLVSAFDTYMHTIIIDAILDLFFGGNQQDKIKFDIPLKTVIKMKTQDENLQRQTLHSLLLERLAKCSYQSPRGVENAINLVGMENIWKKVSILQNEQAEDIKARLSLIAQRRNKIAHETDYDVATGTYTKIEKKDVIDCKDFLSSLVEAIQNIFEAAF